MIFKERQGEKNDEADQSSTVSMDNKRTKANNSCCSTVKTNTLFGNKRYSYFFRIFSKFLKISYEIDFKVKLGQASDQDVSFTIPIETSSPVKENQESIKGYQADDNRLSAKVLSCLKCGMSFETLKEQCIIELICFLNYILFKTPE